MDVATAVDGTTDVGASGPFLDLVDESPESLYAALAEQGWGDGLPVVAPTEARVEQLLAGYPGSVDEVLAVLPPRSGAQPASTALTATMRRVTWPNRGGRVARTSSGSTSPRAASAASTRSGVGGTNGRPSPQPRSAYAASTASGESSTTSTMPADISR